MASPHASKAWAQRGFTGDEARTWQAVGCTPAAAARFVRLGVGPDHAERWYRLDKDWYWLESLIRSGCPVGEAERWIGAGVPIYRVESLRNRGATFDRLEPWLAAGFDADEATAFAAQFTSPHECLGWRDWMRDHDIKVNEQTVADTRRAPLTPTDAARWAKSGIPPELIPFLSTIGGLDEVIGLPAHTGFSFRTLVMLLRSGESLADLTSPSRPRSEDDNKWAEYTGAPMAAWAAWRNAGCDPRSTKKFLDAGVQDPAEAADWIAHRFSIGSVRDYRAVGLSPNESAVQQRLGHQPQHLRRRGGSVEFQDPDEWTWTDFVSPPPTRARVFALRRSPRGDIDLRFQRALHDLGARHVSFVSLFSPAYHAWAFLDGGISYLWPYGFMGPERWWVVGSHALALLCHRMHVQLPRTGRFRDIPDADTLTLLWSAQRVERAEELKAQAEALTVANRPDLEAAEPGLLEAFARVVSAHPHSDGYTGGEP